MAADKSNPAVFVTGTDTGVGKSIVAAALAKHFTAKGLKVGVMKPVETGVADPARLGPDAQLLRWAAESNDADELISPYRFKLPASPHQAAAAEQRSIDAEAIVNAFQTLRKGKDIILVEGAGGLMVPLRGGYLMADLAGQLGLAMLLVTHPKLGTLNHTLLTTYTARAMNLDLSGFIINRMPKAPDATEQEAPHSLASLASTDLLGVLPETTGTDRDKVTVLAEEIEKMPAYFWLLSAFGLQL